MQKKIWLAIFYRKIGWKMTFHGIFFVLNGSFLTRIPRVFHAFANVFKRVFHALKTLFNNTRERIILQKNTKYNLQTFKYACYTSMNHELQNEALIFEYK